MIEKKFTLRHWLGFLLIFIEIAIASIHPLEVESYLLHQVGTVLMLILLVISFKKIGLDFLSFSFYLGFLFIHILAAHYLYSYVPYNDWIKSLFGFDLNASMHWSRNMYDRLVHFSYGFLLFPFFQRIFHVYFPQASRKQLNFLVIQWIMASSMLYELIEWWIAIGLSPEAAENYNGQQGDVWDAHKDMFLASIGCLIFAAIDLIQNKLSQHKP